MHFDFDLFDSVLSNSDPSQLKSIEFGQKNGHANNETPQMNDDLFSAIFSMSHTEFSV